MGHLPFNSWKQYRTVHCETKRVVLSSQVVAGSTVFFINKIHFTGDLDSPPSGARSHYYSLDEAFDDFFKLT